MHSSCLLVCVGMQFQLSSDFLLLQAEASSKGPVENSFYLRLSESEELQPVTYQTDFSAYNSQPKVRLLHSQV